jgi:hypothetical protein
LPRDRHVEFLDSQPIRLALIRRLYRSEAIRLFAAKNDDRQVLGGPGACVCVGAMGSTEFIPRRITTKKSAARWA